MAGVSDLLPFLLTMKTELLDTCHIQTHTRALAHTHLGKESLSLAYNQIIPFPDLKKEQQVSLEDFEPY